MAHVIGPLFLLAAVVFILGSILVVFKVRAWCAASYNHFLSLRLHRCGSHAIVTLRSVFSLMGLMRLLCTLSTMPCLAGTLLLLAVSVLVRLTVSISFAAGCSDT